MSEVKVDTISERTTDAGVTIEGVKVEDGVATFQTAAGSPLVFEGATANAFETTFAITDPTQDRTITFPDASITLAAAGVNTPTWWVGMSSATQSLSDMVKTIIELDDVEFNEGFTWDTTNFKGVPGTAGKYLINCYAHMGDNVSGNNAGLCEVSLFVDTTEVAYWGIDVGNTTANNMKVGGSTILDLSAANYLQMKCTIDSATATVRQVSATKRSTYLCGMKLIEA